MMQDGLGSWLKKAKASVAAPEVACSETRSWEERKLDTEHKAAKLKLAWGLTDEYVPRHLWKPGRPDIDWKWRQGLHLAANRVRNLRYPSSH